MIGSPWEFETVLVLLVLAECVAEPWFPPCKVLD